MRGVCVCVWSMYVGMECVCGVCIWSVCVCGACMWSVCVCVCVECVCDFSLSKCNNDIACVGSDYQNEADPVWLLTAT